MLVNQAETDYTTSAGCQIDSRETLTVAPCELGGFHRQIRNLCNVKRWPIHVPLWRCQVRRRAYSLVVKCSWDGRADFCAGCGSRSLKLRPGNKRRTGGVKENRSSRWGWSRNGCFQGLSDIARCTDCKRDFTDLKCQAYHAQSSCLCRSCTDQFY